MTQGGRDVHSLTSDAHGILVSCGAQQAPRLLAARLRPALRDVHLVPQPRGAFSDLAAATLAEQRLAPEEVRLLVS